MTPLGSRYDGAQRGDLQYPPIQGGMSAGQGGKFRTSDGKTTKAYLN